MPLSVDGLIRGGSSGSGWEVMWVVVRGVEWTQGRTLSTALPSTILGGTGRVCGTWCGRGGARDCCREWREQNEGLKSEDWQKWQLTGSRGRE